MPGQTRAEFLRVVLGGALAISGKAAAKPWLTWPFPSRSSPVRSVSIEPTRVDPKARVAHVQVRLSGPPLNTVIVPVATRNGTDFFPERRALAGVNYKALSQLVVFRPGDDPVKVVSIGLMGGRADQWFELVIPAQVQGAIGGATSAQIRFAAGAVNGLVPTRSRPLKTPYRGAQSFELDLAGFQAADSGFIDGRPCLKSRFSHGRTQPANQELGLYTDPGLYPGTRPFELREGVLVLRAEKLAPPIRNPADGRTYDFGSSVLTTQTLLAQTYGYFEWEARLNSAPGTWGGLWLLPENGSWPPEVDVMEVPRNGRYGKSDTNAAAHWSVGGRHMSVSARLPIDQLLGRAINLVDDFHRHAVEWRRDFTTWFVDDVEVFQAPTNFHLPAYALMDVAVGGWGGAPDLGQGSPEMLIRGMRVWR